MQFRIFPLKYKICYVLDSSIMGDSLFATDYAAPFYKVQLLYIVQNLPSQLLHLLCIR